MLCPPVNDWIFEVPNLALKKASRVQGINLSIASLSVILCNFRTAASGQVLCHSVVHPVAPPQPSLAEIPRPAKFALITQRQVIAQRKNKRSPLKPFVNPLYCRVDMTRHGSCVHGSCVIELYCSRCLCLLPTRRTNRVIAQGQRRTKDDDRIETAGTTNKEILR